MIRGDEFDPKNLIRESFRIEGISEPECRSIFLDWALSLASSAPPDAAIRTLLERYSAAPDDHPMLKTLKEGLEKSGKTGRRGGRAGRFADPS